MQFDWTLALPITLLLVYFLFMLQRYCWRIYRRFRLPADAAVTGAFNMGGQLDGSPPPTSEELAQQEQYELHQRMSAMQISEQQQQQQQRAAAAPRGGA